LANFNDLRLCATESLFYFAGFQESGRDILTRKPKPPVAPLKILAQVKHGSAELPPTARRIATFIVKNAGDVIRMSITELAEQAEASEGSVVAFCRRVGATGFQDLKILLARDLVDPVQLIHEDLKPGHTVDEVGERVFAAHAASLAS
jgi:RpiR family transcriptional regulator, carbohydrate utilization regulator